MILIEIVTKLIKRFQAIFSGEAGIVYAAALFLVTYWAYKRIRRNRGNKKIQSPKLFITDLLIWTFVVISVALAYRIAIRKTTPVYLSLTYQRELEREFPVPPEYLFIDKVRAGDVSYNSLGKQVAQVMEITRNYWGSNREAYSILLKIEANFNKKTGEFIFDGKPLLVGNKISLPVGKTQLNAVIADFFQDEKDRLRGYKQARATVSLKGRFYEPWQAESLRNFQIFDSQGKIMVDTKKIEIEQAEYSFTTNGGVVLKLRDPIKKDVTIVLEINNILCSGQTCYVNQIQPLKIGHSLWLTSDKTVLPGPNIMDFEIQYIDE
jgi:hypothetical protein